MAKMRLDRLLAGQGTQTRKEVRELIRKGRVTVNGQPEKAVEAFGRASKAGYAPAAENLKALQAYLDLMAE